MKLIDKAVTILLNICLLICAVIFPALSMASSKEYYRTQFEKNEIYEHENKYGEKIVTTIYFINGDENLKAQFKDSQLDLIAEHIISYLFGNTDSFVLYMDDVLLNGETANGVSIFGETAVSHMKDVKELISAASSVTTVALVLLPILLVYIVLRRKSAGEYALKYTARFYFVIGGFAFVFLLVSFVEALILPFRFSMDLYGNVIWRNIHYLLFPFQPEKIANSFFNDTLTFVLTVDLFLDAVLTVLLIYSAAILFWLLIAIFCKKASIKA